MARPAPIDIDAARERVRGLVRRTPVLRLDAPAFGVATPIVIKLEQLQHTGSFKTRGAFNQILAAGTPGRVVAASGGNFGLAVAYAAKTLGIHAEIFLPEVVDPAKARRLQLLGAETVIVPGFYADAFAASSARAASAGVPLLHAYDNAAMIAGNGCVAQELLADAPDVSTILVAVGGGGLISGMAIAAGTTVRVVGVETRGTQTMYAALAAGSPVDINVTGLAADSLGAKRMGDLPFEIVCRAGLTAVLVDDNDVRRAQRLLWDEARLVAEPGGATALAALVAGAYTPSPEEVVALILCGANTDPGAAAG